MGGIPDYSFGKASMPYNNDISSHLHKHNYTEIALVVKGEYTLQTGNRREVLKEGEMVMLGKDTMHSDLLLKGNSSVLFLLLGNYFFNSFSSIEAFKSFQKMKYQYTRFKQINKGSEIPVLFGLIIDEIQKQEEGSKFFIMGAAERILAKLPVDYESLIQKNEKDKNGAITFADITGFIEEHIAEVKIQDLIEEFGHDVFYLNRLIKRHTGDTTVHLIQEKKLEKAFLLLKTTTLSVENIIVQIGYENKSYFYKIFKEKYGCLPHEARYKMSI
jgi:AraC-like DNA-binding protein